MRRWLKRGDFVVYAILLLLTLLSFVPILWTREPGTNAVIRHESGSIVCPLSREDRLTIESKGHTLTVLVSRGRVCVSESSCPDGLCMARGTIARTGETIVCLPAQVVITIEGGEEADADVILG